MTNTATKLNDYDPEQAMWEGWEITTDLKAAAEGRRYVIGAHPTSPRFSNKGEVWAFLICQCLKGEKYHHFALSLIRDHARDEWEDVVNFARMILGVDLPELVSSKGTAS